jgi:hypothetical protein
MNYLAVYLLPERKSPALGGKGHPIHNGEVMNWLVPRRSRSF